MTMVARSKSESDRWTRGWWGERKRIFSFFFLTFFPLLPLFILHITAEQRGATVMFALF